MINISQKQKISQQQHLSARQYHSLDMLEVPIQDLQSRIEEAMNSNPLLEYAEYPENSLISPLPDASIENPPAADDDGEYYAENDAWHDDLPIPGTTENFSAEQQQKMDYFFSSLTEKESVHDKLMQELGALKLNAQQKELAEAIIIAIDDNGFLGTNIADIAQSENVDLFEAEEMLQRLQKIFPPGVGARDLSECLKLQLEACNETDPDIYRLVENIEDFGRNKLVMLSEKLNISIEKLNQLGDRIRKLNPFPASELASTDAATVVPEISVTFENGEFCLKQDNNILPSIKISEHYEQMLNNPSITDEVRNYLRNKLNDAKEFKTSLERREKTIIRIARFILENQQEFFLNGVESLRPMTMAQAAAALGNDEATVSRGCKDKYISTPQGTFEFKYFFSGGYTNADGEEVSTRAVQEKIREYIEDEDPYKPLSDEKISQKLLSDGFEVARRTVAKYRELMNILPSSMRRKHQ